MLVTERGSGDTHAPLQPVPHAASCKAAICRCMFNCSLNMHALLGHQLQHSAPPFPLCPFMLPPCCCVLLTMGPATVPHGRLKLHPHATSNTHLHQLLRVSSLAPGHVLRVVDGRRPLVGIQLRHRVCSLILRREPGGEPLLLPQVCILRILCRRCAGGLLRRAWHRHKTWQHMHNPDGQERMPGARAHLNCGCAAHGRKTAPVGEPFGSKCGEHSNSQVVGWVEDVVPPTILYRMCF